jgi:hypothetical protein
VPARLKAVGQRVGVKVHPHRLRHTMATQLLNAGCRVTSLQKFLGHKELSTTMVYARVHDQTMAGDYYAAMQKVEKQLDLSGIPENAETPLAENEREQLLKLTKELAKPVLSAKTRLKIVAQLRQLLQGPDVGQIYSPKLPVPVPIEMAFAET